MADPGFAAQLKVYGPDGDGPPCDLPRAQAYCRQLARSHYENFTVASWLLPSDLRPHFHAIYAYCRWADDLADEVQDAERSLELLEWWGEQLRACYAGQAWHPVFVALRETIGRFGIPSEPFEDLLVAFRQDQRQTRYATRAELLEYCRHSANPVGRLVLYLGRAFTPASADLSDQVCTGLQLANFCQDVAQDYQRGRIYLPSECRERHGYGEADFAAGRFNQAFRELLREQVDDAERHLRAGWPLVAELPRVLRMDVDLIVRGGLEILRATRRQDFDVWRRRPRVSKAAQIRLLLSAWWRAGRKAQAP
ncbi:MAG: squalene synthase HpnC [Pirellulaceae bacterium]|nr:squalene synthase HpnC [Pirellulaceae bacterium]